MTASLSLFSLPPRPAELMCAVKCIKAPAKPSRPRLSSATMDNCRSLAHKRQALVTPQLCTTPLHCRLYSRLLSVGRRMWATAALVRAARQTKRSLGPAFIRAQTTLDATVIVAPDIMPSKNLNVFCRPPMLSRAPRGAAAGFSIWPRGWLGIWLAGGVKQFRKATPKFTQEQQKQRHGDISPGSSPSPSAKSEKTTMERTTKVDSCNRN